MLGSKEANALGIEGFGDDHIFVLEYLLRGKSLAEIRQLIRTREFERFASLDGNVETLAEGLRTSPLFKQMLVNG